MLYAAELMCAQEMGFDSIPFEEPELFRARSGLPALPSLADKDQSQLHLRLDSQDMLDGSPHQVSWLCQPAQAHSLLPISRLHALSCWMWAVCSQLFDIG